MTKLVLHVGTQKTGSKALQRFIACNEALLLEHGCRFPHTYRDGNWHRSLFDRLNTAQSTELRAELTGYPCALISYEGLYKASESMVEFLVSLADRVSILMFVRPQTEWFNSSLNQQFKSHGITHRNIEHFTLDNPSIVERFELDGHVRRWERVARGAEIRLFRYHPSVELYNIVLDLLGIPDASRSAFAYPSDNPNKAADLHSIRVLRYLKQTIGDDVPRLERVMKVAHARLQSRWIDTRCEAAPLLISGAQIEQLKGLYEQSNDQMCERYGLAPFELGVNAGEDSGGTVPADLTPSPQVRAEAERVLHDAEV